MYYSISQEEILNTREKHVRDARKAIIYIGNKYMGQSLEEMGKRLGIRKTGASMAIKGGREIVEKGKLLKALI